MKKYSYTFTLLLAFITLLSCKPEETAQQIVDKTITAHGGDSFDNLDLTFTFRKVRYGISKHGGAYTYARRNGNTVDVLTNEGYTRKVNDILINQDEKDIAAQSSGLNSVAYFALLPYGLNDTAVIKERLEDVSIKGKEYYKIRITFNADGGGEDYEDVFMYWINKEDNYVDYLAYSYCEKDCGLRFRQSINRRSEAITIQDYNNYKPKNASLKPSDLDEAFENDGLELLSEILLEDAQIRVD